MIQTKPGPVVADSDDLVIEHRGKRVLAKVMFVGAHPSIIAYSQPVGGSTWTPEGLLDCFPGDSESIFSNDNDRENGGVPMTPPDWIAKYGGPLGFVKSFVCPRLNEILARMFPAGEMPVDPLQAVHSIIGSLRVVKAADGTVRVEAP